MAHPRSPQQSRLLRPTRREFVQGLAVVAGAASLPLSLARAAVLQGTELRGPNIDLTIGETPVNITGRPAIATLVNGSMPAPVLRFREGDDATIRVTNRLKESTSIHWHGLKLPNAMDGVPGLTFAGIPPGETFTYRFPIIQSGTYWYHSHSGMQEQTGLFGALILEPKAREPYAYDRDYTVVLSDWTDEDPMTVVANLKQQGDYYNYHQRTLGTFIDDAKRDGLGATIKDRLMWGKMRMSPTDIMDVTGAIYTFLINGQPPAANWTGLFKPGERVRLRFINSASMSTFDVRIPDLGMMIVQADGSDVEPVTVDEFRIGVAETFDVIVEPKADANTIFVQAQDRSGFARGTLATRAGLTAAIPPMDPRPMRTMADMGMGNMDGMDMGSMPGMKMDQNNAMPGMAMPPPAPSPAPMPGMNMPSGDHGAMAGMNMPGMDMGKPASAPAATGSMSGMDMGGMQMGDHQMPMPDTLPATNASGVDPKTLEGTPGVDNVAMETGNKSGEAGVGLDANGRRVLTYAHLKSIEPMSDMAMPTRDIEFHLTGNMERWVWGFDGKKFSEAPPVRVTLGETVRFVLINDTMMEHPIHLHGFLFALENGQTANMPMKHTVNVKPAERVSFIYTADTPGHWAFHCHLMFHMETGMFRTVIVA
jgi:FtsP/CotA-like multicopper oxidase with cupredoxin domain